MRKAEVAAFYAEAVASVGRADLRITGHSPRVTGAQRMARAGHLPALIQLFGRWGSNAVFGYVRDALLGEKGSAIAKRTDLLNKLDVEDCRSRLTP